MTTKRALAVRQPSGLALTKEQLELVKRTLAKGATNDELALYLYDCNRRGVHPLDRLIHFTVRTEQRSGERHYTPIVSIDYARSRAAESGEYAGSDDAAFKEAEPYPESATVTVWRLVQGQRVPFTATARWKEYYPGDGVPGFMYRRMPHVMLAKCGEMLALRKAFPQQLSGLYIEEELEQAPAVEGVPASPASAEGPVGEEDQKAIRDAGKKATPEHKAALTEYLRTQGYADWADFLARGKGHAAQALKILGPPESA